jgi:hypothetical protein
MTCADTFLSATDFIYDECQQGISTLSRIVVATPSALSGEARTALIPALYAYWERFFKLTFSEYLRSVTLEAITVDKASTTLVRLRIRRAAIEFENRARGKLLTAVDKDVLGAAKTVLADLIRDVGAMDALYTTPLTFANPDEWIDTESNVRFRVLEKNCKLLGLDTATLTKLLSDAGMQLYTKLEDLVETRNKIAHGEVLHPTDSARWNDLQSFVSTLMHAVQFFLHEHLEQDEHLI